MRRWLATATTALAVVLIASVALAASSETYLDRFSSQSFGGSDGTLEWSADWQEIPGSEPDGPTAGAVQVASAGCPEGSYCLLITSNGLDLVPTGASRSADLSVLSDATLGFKMDIDLPGLINLTDGILYVQATTGSGWNTLGSYPLLLNEGLSQESITLAESYLSEAFQLRFIVSGILDGDVRIDYVELRGQPTPTTTTSTTTTTTTSTTSTSSTSTTSTTSTTTTLPVTTTLPTVTTTLPTVTTTTLPPLLTTTTTPSTTTTTEAATTGGSSDSTTTTSGSTSNDDDDGASSGETDSTTTTTQDETSTTEDESTVIQPVEPPEDPGLRQGSIGLQVGYQDGRLGEIAESPELLGVSIEPSYTMAAEVFESSWIYLLVLLLVIATAIVSGMDRRRLKRAKHTRVGLIHRTA